MLSGHTDVVSIDDQDWSTDPFVLIEKDDRLFARGISDMKSFVAAVLAMVAEFADGWLTTPIKLAFPPARKSAAEAPSLIEHIPGLAIQPKACIVGEPTDIKVVTPHNKRYRCEVHGHESHSALAHRGVGQSISSSSNLPPG